MHDTSGGTYYCHAHLKNEAPSQGQNHKVTEGRSSQEKDGREHEYYSKAGQREGWMLRNWLWYQELSE